MVLTYTAARAGAVARLKIGDYYSDGTQWWFHFGEKGGKVHLVPARHNLQLQMAAYIAAAGLAGQPDKSPLFRTARNASAQLTDRPLTGNDLLRIVKRRLKAAGLPEGTFSCHSFRATTATDLLKHDVRASRSSTCSAIPTPAPPTSTTAPTRRSPQHRRSDLDLARFTTNAHLKSASVAFSETAR